MCRLYGFSANEPTKVECTLVHAQNALMVQARKDLAGWAHANGWGIATYEAVRPHVERQVWAAYHGEHFKRAAARIYSQQVLAHVRRATVGPPTMENTHPFVDGKWSFIHNGTVPNFDLVKPRLLAQLSEDRRRAIHGDTDSEHFFHYLRHLHLCAPERPLIDVLRHAVRQILEWCQEIDASAPIGLNVILTDGEHMLGSRVGRSLHFVERVGVQDCEICGFPHVHHDPHKRYRAVIVASEPISHENWRETPQDSVYEITPDFTLRAERL
ncbi:MAG: class II glutamine amidotransferase [Alphaproteobacteria bacterium]|nr:class II glutamine amidotransferase [Alphaproteobacteria bacterium]